ncbi:MAG: hypothetical protein P8171_23430, partial [Candidatus Thiodiazotropha sp.]
NHEIEPTQPFWNTNETNMNKITKNQAVTTHIGLSMLLVGGLVAVVLLYWYPWDLLDLQGGAKILLLVIFIDAILGPSLTFLVYKPNKRFLALDLTVIAMIQIAALSYGTFTLYQGKVSYLVLLRDKFHTVKQMDLVGEIPFDLMNTQRIGPYGPYIVETETQAGSNDFTFILSALMNDHSPAYIASYYRPFPIDKAKLDKVSLGLDELPSKIANRVHQIANKLKIDPKALVCLPIQGTAKTGVAIFKPDAVALLDIIADKPIKATEKTTQ